MSVGAFPFETALAGGVAALRAVGVARLGAERIAGETVAIDVEEQGPLRLRFPRLAAPGRLEAVIVNTGGGIAGGDRLDFTVQAGEGASVALTSQAAEKIYRSGGAAASISVHLAVAPRAQLAWLPQEAILFDRARVQRRIEADVAGDAALTVCETVVFGRTAMGETVATGLLQDRWRIRRDGKLLFADALTLGGGIERILARPAVARGAFAAGTILQVARDAEARIDAVRAALDLNGVEAGASAFDGILVVRLLAREGFLLRAASLAALSALGTEPPRAFTL